MKQIQIQELYWSPKGNSVTSPKLQKMYKFLDIFLSNFTIFEPRFTFFMDPVCYIFFSVLSSLWKLWVSHGWVISRATLYLFILVFLQNLALLGLLLKSNNSVKYNNCLVIFSCFCHTRHSQTVGKFRKWWLISVFYSLGLRGLKNQHFYIKCCNFGRIQKEWWWWDHVSAVT